MNKNMRDFQFKLEIYSERTGQSTNWLRGNIYFYLPCLLILHMTAILFVLPTFTLDIYSVILYIYAGASILIGLAAMVTFLRGLAVAYHLIITFSFLNAIRCIIITCVLSYSIMVSILYPPANEAEAHMPIAFLALFFLLIIAIEITASSMHIANIVYVRKRENYFMH